MLHWHLPELVAEVWKYCLLRGGRFLGPETMAVVGLHLHHRGCPWNPYLESQPTPQFSILSFPIYHHQIPDILYLFLVFFFQVECKFHCCQHTDSKNINHGVVKDPVTFEINNKWVQTHCAAQYTCKFCTFDMLSITATISSKVSLSLFIYIIATIS